MNIQKDQYKRFADAHAPRSPIVKNCILAFLFGGGICAFSELLFSLYSYWDYLDVKSARALASVSLVFIAVFLTGIGIFDKIAKHAGAGTLVPITGFANAVASPAIDSRAEGYILGVGAKIFTVAGPVLLYSTVTGALYGVIYWICSLF